ncbi:MAG TPA: Holliday junction branch migration protein RuvA [Candidatus Binataceae bacterium]|nr:Holliday junction branch migration protein RuvA [Candidatus Binataceae bacterium]
MIASISGTLRVREPGRVVVETGGIGYEVLVPLSTYYRLPAVGGPVFLEIRQIVREDALMLYGFSEPTEKRAFDLLIGVQHVGPKHALSILSALTPDDLAGAITREDIHKIDAVPGVGPKVAERVIRELRDKVGSLRGPGAPPIKMPPTVAGAAATNGAGSMVNDAVSALVNLAYTPIEARRAVDAILAESPSADLETVIRKSLAILLSER